MSRGKIFSKSCAPRELAKGDPRVALGWELWCQARDLAAARAADRELTEQLAGETTWSERWWWILGKLDEARGRLIKLEGSR